jgi:hypothetical protein
MRQVEDEDDQIYPLLASFIQRILLLLIFVFYDSKRDLELVIWLSLYGSSLRTTLSQRLIEGEKRRNFAYIPSSALNDNPVSLRVGEW